MRSSTAVFARLAMVVPAWAWAAEPAELPKAPWMAIVQPGYPGSTAEAETFMAQFTKYVGEASGLAGLGGAYYNDAKKALAAIAERDPPFGLVSLGFYLEQRKKLGLTALAAARPWDAFVVLGPPGAEPAKLAGKTVAGGPLHEVKFLERIAFRDKAPVGAWEAAPTYAARALRETRRAWDPKAGEKARGRYDAAVLTGRDFKGLKGLDVAKGLAVVLESEKYPPSLLVAFGARPPEEGAEGAGTGGGEGPAKPALSSEEMEKVVQAFLDFPKNPAGRDLLREMGAEGFDRIDREWLAKMEVLYDAEPEKK